MMAADTLRAPFPYFGGKSAVAHAIWEWFGEVGHYVEPFFGSGAVLLGRPATAKGWGLETVNDADALLANVWRAIKAEPEEVARLADYPVIEADLEARNYWLLCQRPRIREMMADPDAYDVKAAAWWIWGASAWLGSGWASADGPWIVRNGRWVKDSGHGVWRKLPNVVREKGIHRKLPPGVTRRQFIERWIARLAERLREVRVVCGDWRRVVAPSVLSAGDSPAVYLDPPYTVGGDRYAEGCETGALYDEVWSWAMEHGDRLKIALSGYDDGRKPRPGWSVVAWTAGPGYSRGRNGNRHRERVYFSPRCDGALRLPLEGVA